MLYHLTVNTAATGFQGAAQIIGDIVLGKQVLPTPPIEVARAQV